MDGVDIKHSLFIFLAPVGMVAVVLLAVCFAIRDYLCPHCGATNGSRRGECGDCGRPMAVKQTAAGVVDPNAGAAAGQSRALAMPWLAWPILLVVVAALASCQFGAQSYRDHDGHEEFYSGWPVACLFQSTGPNRHDWHGHVRMRKRVRLETTALVMDLAASLAIAAATLVVSEKMLRRPGNGRRWRLGSMCLAMAVAGVIVAGMFAEAGGSHYPFLWRGRTEMVVQSPTAAWCAWQVRLPVLFGVGCVLYTAGRLMGSGLASLSNRTFNRAAPVKAPLGTC